jgi:Tol biopolymer transport system component
VALGAAGVLVALVLLVPLIRVVVVAVHDALSPLPDVPAPHATLPPSESVVPPGMMAFDSNRTGNFEIYLMSSTGTGVRQLTRDRRFDSWWAQISPDRRYVLFYRSPRGVHDSDPSKNSLWVMDGDGTHQTELRPVGTDGWRIQGHAEWSPGGERLVMSGGSRINPQIYVTTATGRDPVDVTDGRGGTNIDPSWAPDGRSVWFVGCPDSFCTSSDYEVYSLMLTRRAEPVRFTVNGLPDYDPSVSPNGRTVAWLEETAGGSPGQWNIMIADVNGSHRRDLTHDSDVNSKPAWSTDGSTIYFHRLLVGRSEAFGIWAIAAEGGAPRPILPARGTTSSEYPDA